MFNVIKMDFDAEGNETDRSSSEYTTSLAALKQFVGLATVIESTGYTHTSTNDEIDEDVFEGDMVIYFAYDKDTGGGCDLLITES